MDNLRSIVVSMSIPNINQGSKGYFHKWCDLPHYDSSLDYPIRKTLALVEFQDGSLKFMEPETIRFVEPLSKKMGT